MEMTVKVGATKDGIIRGIDLHTLSNTGAYGEHGPTTVGLSGHKSIPLYGKTDAFKFSFDVVYTNVMSAGAYRGYGAPQGIFAVESAVNELAVKMNMDPVKLRELNMVKEGQKMYAYYGEQLNSCALDRCMAKAKEMIKWDEKYPARDLGNGKVRSVGVAMAMQGSGISKVDTAAVSLKVNDDGFYSMGIGAADMGTGCDTILAQIAADCLDCSVDDIVVHGVDTDSSPYDKGSYASSTAYVTGMATVKTCEVLVEKIKKAGASKLKCDADKVDFDGTKVYNIETNESISLKDIGNAEMDGNRNSLYATESFSSQTSPPPFMVGMAEVEIDKETGKVDLIDYVGVVDCGTVINSNITRIQAEGGIAQGIGMALYEDIIYSDKGQLYNNSFMQYKIPTRLDVGTIRVDFESSYEPTGPFGAKSIGEVVINTPSPAIAGAVLNGVGVCIRELPITAEKVYNAMQELK
jgi:CO/xanthine dehydrogenase Mo-binding subunit